MFPIGSMFGMVDPKTIKDTLMDNEEYLEKVIERLPYIGDEYKKEKELERQRAEREAAGEDVYGEEEEENNENQDNNVQQENPANSESYLERIKKGVSYYWNSLFVNQNQQPPAGDVLPKDDQYTVVSMETPIDNTKKIEIKGKNSEVQAA